MKVERRDGSVEKKIVTAMIVNTEVLARISSVWDKDGNFKSRWSNIVGAWCVNHYLKYGEAPGKQIETRFQKWAENKEDKETVSLVERFLETLSGEYQSVAGEIKPAFITDLAVELFNRVRLHKHRDKVEELMESGKITEAVNLTQQFDKIELNTSEPIDPFFNKEAIQNAFAHKHEPLIQYPGALGQFFKDSLERTGFVAFMASDKVGKSFWLQEIAFTGMLQRRKVAMFVVTDMSQQQILLRLMTRTARRPLRPTEQDKPVKYPKKIYTMPGESTAVVEVEERHFKKELSWRDAWEACQKTLKLKVKDTRNSMFKLKVDMGAPMSVRTIESELNALERKGWVPDIVVIDYADYLAALDGRDDSLQQINKTWAALRSLALKRNCLVVTATQANALAYKSKLITRVNFSGNKLKLALVTDMIGISQTDEEKELDITRLNHVVLREGEFHATQCVHVAGCRALSNVAVRSTW